MFKQSLYKHANCIGVYQIYWYVGASARDNYDIYHFNIEYNNISLSRGWGGGVEYFLKNYLPLLFVEKNA